MVRLILGRAGAGKTALVFKEIAQYAAQGQGNMILLVPEQYSHEAERELCAAAGDSLSRYGEVLSFTGLARKVFAQQGGARPVMDGAGRLLCMAVALRAVGDRLRVYQRGRRDPRVPDSLARAVEELKNAGITADMLLKAAGETEGALADKLHDLALLTEAYAACQGRSGVDPSDRLERLAELIGGSPVARGRIYVDGFSDFTVLEKNVLRELIRAGAELTVCLTCAREGNGDSVFALPLSTARWLGEVSGEYGVACREEWLEPDASRRSPISWLCDHLFDFTREEPPATEEAIRLVSAPGIYEECELAAARMAELARTGCRWRDMAVAVRGFGDYRTALESACARYGVPLFLSGRGDTLQKSVPLLITSALEAVCRGYEYEAMFGYLKTGLTPIPMEDVDKLENYALLWAVRGGQWDRPWAMHPEGYNRAMDEAAQDTMANLNDLRAQVIAPLKGLERRTKEATSAQEQARALAAFFQDIALVERLQERRTALARAGRQEAAAEHARLWDVVCSALEQFAGVLGDMPMDAEQFQGLFSLMLSKYDVNVIPVSMDRVSAGDIDGMRRRHTRHLLLLGAADGRLPAPDEGGGVFTAEERELLAGMDIPLGGAEEELSRELLRVYSCLTLPSETLYMSYARADGGGGEARPSLVMERARALFDLPITAGDLTRARTFSRDAAFTLAVQGQAGDSDPRCRTAREYFIREGREEELVRLTQAAEAGRGNLGPEAVRALYGAKPRLTATRAEKFNHCRFGYFLQYGLKARPRQQAVFDPRDYGTFMHYILENVAREAMDMGGFAQVTGTQIGQLTDKYVDKYIAEEMHGFADKTARFEYLFRRLRATVHRVTEDMWQELKNSRFEPIGLELDLRAEGVLEPDGEGDVPLAGLADRVDGWRQGGTLYLKITDYKTGAKKFSLSDVCQGLNMQMLLYLFTLQNRGGKHLDAEIIRPAGVLYSPARFEIVPADSDVTDEELEKLRQPTLKRSGLLLNDEAVLEAMEPGESKRYLPVKILKKTGTYSQDNLATLEQFGALSRYIGDTLRELADQLRSGSVTADPWYKNARDNACAFCDYRQACLFDETGDGWRLRTHLSTAEAWERIEKRERV